MSISAVGLPRQKLPLSKKTQKWREECVDAVVGMGFGTHGGGRSSRESKQINYNLVNGIFSESDFKYILNPYNIDEKDLHVNSPSQLRSYNIILPKLNRLKGEEIRRPFPFEVFAVNGQAVSQKEQQIRNDLLVHLKNYIEKSLEGEEIEEPESVRKAMMTSYKSHAEESIGDLMKFLYQELNLKYQFNRGFEHGLISSEEIYRVGIKNGEPYLRSVNPLYCDFERTPDLDWIEECSWFREDRYMTPAEILDEYGDFLSDRDIDKIDSMDITAVRPPEEYLSGIAYNEPLRSNTIPTYGANGQFIQVSIACWKSMKRIGFLSYMDPETEELVEEVVDENFEITEQWEEVGAEIEWRWITETWEGVKVGNDIYPYIEPLPNQLRDPENPARGSSLPYIGSLYNMTNTEATSFVDFLKPYQYLYNIMWFRMEEEIAKAKGKKFIMDLAQLPKSEGFDLEKWMQYFDNLGIGFINSKEEGKQQLGPNAASSFNQFQAVDMSLSQAIGQYIGILTKIEQTIDSVSGIPKQAEGQVQASETATGIRAALDNSSFVTELYFYRHSEIKKRVLTQLIEVASLAYIDGKRMQYILDDVGLINLRITGEDLNMSKFGIYVTDSILENINRDKIEQLAFAAMQNQMLNFSDIIKIYTNSSLNKSLSEIKNAETEKAQREQQAAQQEQQLRQQELQQKAVAEQEKIENENINKQLDRETSIQVATIQAMDKDSANQSKENIVALQSQNKEALENLKDTRETAIKEKELQLKEKEIENKKEIEKVKAQTALKVARENKNKYDV